uniref:5-formyltetrahydrofolate cyclo-ligase n=2 Tax=Clastoptera arizonana TaxID=38151 RepID=A0A1B6DQ05_9HEMI
MKKLITIFLFVFSSRSYTMASNSSALTSLKSALRLEMKKKLAALSNEEKQRQSDIVVTKLFSHPTYKQSTRVSVFLNMTDEIQTTKIVEDILKSGKKCFIPRYDKDEMVMVRLNSLQDYDSLPLTKWKIKQPLKSDKREDSLETGGLDLVIVPGLAFTKSGGRMGRGKGYYDKYLEKCKSKNNQLKTIAVAFKEQVLKDIPVGPNDFKIDDVLSAD